MSGLVYGGKFEALMNELSSPENVAATAEKFRALEQKHGAYSFGKFVKLTTPQASEYSNWETHAGGIPESIQNRLTEIISANFRSAAPMPMRLKVGDNIDATHDLYVRTFAHNGHIYIGLHMLCPNPDLK
ncbi:MAG: hypothetical protein ACXW4O_16130 [Candidatus Binatia bacterium]